MVLEAKKSKTKVLADPVTDEACSWVADCQLVFVSSNSGKTASWLCGVFLKGH